MQENFELDFGLSISIVRLSTVNDPKTLVGGTICFPQEGGLFFRVTKVFGSRSFSL